MRRAAKQPRFDQIELTNGEIWGVVNEQTYDPFDLYERGMTPHLNFANTKDPLGWHREYGPLFGFTSAYSATLKAFQGAQRRFVTLLNLWQGCRGDRRDIAEFVRRAVAETGYVTLPGHAPVVRLNREWEAEANGQELSAEEEGLLLREFPTFAQILAGKTKSKANVTIGGKHPYLAVEEFIGSASREDLRRAAEDLLKLALAARLEGVQPDFSDQTGFQATWAVRDFLQACYLMLFYDIVGKKTIRNCKHCGQFFYPATKRPRFCSTECARRDRQQRYWKRRGKLVRKKRLQLGSGIRAGNENDNLK